MDEKPPMTSQEFQKSLELVSEACKNYGKRRPDGTIQGYEATFTPDELRQVIDMKGVEDA